MSLQQLEQPGWANPPVCSKTWLGGLEGIETYVLEDIPYKAVCCGFEENIKLVAPGTEQERSPDVLRFGRHLPTLHRRQSGSFNLTLCRGGRGLKRADEAVEFARRHNLSPAHPGHVFAAVRSGGLPLNKLIKWGSFPGPGVIIPTLLECPSAPEIKECLTLWYQGPEALCRARVYESSFPFQNFILAAFVSRETASH